MSKVGAGELVEGFYNSDLQISEIEAHYKKQLIDRGYKFLKKESLKSWEKDYGEQEIHYCKDDVHVGIHFPGNYPQREKFLYALSISSGSFECS